MQETMRGKGSQKIPGIEMRSIQLTHRNENRSRGEKIGGKKKKTGWILLSGQS